VISLVEKAIQDVDAAKAEAMARKLAKGKFDLEDMAEQFRQMRRMGGMEGLMGLLPGVQKIKKQLAEADLSDKMIKRQEAIISSMTPQERRKPDILAASRKRRIAAGSGVEVQEVNRLLKQHRQMSDAFKAMSRDGGRGLQRMASMLGMGGPGGGGAPPGLPPGMGGISGPDLERLKALGAGKLPGLGGPAAPGGLPGLGGGLPGLPFGKPKP